MMSSNNALPLIQFGKIYQLSFKPDEALGSSTNISSTSIDNAAQRFKREQAEIFGNNDVVLFNVESINQHEITEPCYYLATDEATPDAQDILQTRTQEMKAQEKKNPDSIGLYFQNMQVFYQMLLRNLSPQTLEVTVKPEDLSRIF